MNPLLLGAVVAGQVALAGAALVLSRVIQQLQLDARKPGPLVDRPDRQAQGVRPAELERLERLVADALASEAAAAGQLGPLLASLGRDAPGGPVPVPSPGGDRRRWLAAVTRDLERAWGLPEP